MSEVHIKATSAFFATEGAPFRSLRSVPLKDEEVMLEERGDDRSLAELDADGDGSATKSGAELVGPVTEGSWRVGDYRALTPGGACGAKANVVLPVGPIDADERGEGNGIVHG